jgi:hypothetical protein
VCFYRTYQFSEQRDLLNSTKIGEIVLAFDKEKINDLFGFCEDFMLDAKLWSLPSGLPARHGRE